MNRVWQIQDAKAHLETIIEQAIHFGTQIIQTRQKEEVVILSIAAYRKLAKKEDSLVDFFQQSPLYGLPLDLERNSDTGRDIDL